MIGIGRDTETKGREDMGKAMEHDAQQARAVAFWTCTQDEERLSHTSIDEAVEQWADDMHPEPLPETVTVYGFARMPLPSVDRLAGDALERMLEYLDEDYGDPEGSSTGPTPSMLDAAGRFAEVVRAEYQPWACEEVTSITVRVADYVPAEWMQAKPEAPAHA